MNRIAALPSRDLVFDIAMSATLTGLALVGLRSSYGGSTYLVVGLVGVVCGIALGGALHRRLSTVAVIASLAAAYVVIGGVVAFRDRSIGGVFPSVDTMSATLNASVAGWKQLVTTSPPVGDLGNLMALPFFCGVFGAGLALLLARTCRVISLSGLPPFAVLVFAIASGTSDPVSVLVHGSVFAGSALWWMAVRYRRSTSLVQLSQRDRRARRASAVAFLAACSVVGLLLGPGLPLVHANDRALLRDSVVPPFDPRQYPSPLSRYREILKGPLENKALFTIENLPEGVPIRLSTLDSYDGVVWQMSGTEAARPGASGYFERVGSILTPAYRGTSREITVTIDNWSEVWIPTVGEVRSIRFLGPRAEQLEAAFRYSAGADTAALQGMVLQKGDGYVMDVVLPTSLENAAKAASPSVLKVPYSTGKEQVPAALASWAAPIAQETADPVERALTIAERLRSGGAYSDGVDDGKQAQVPGGHSSGRLSQFIEEKTTYGNAEQYAAAGTLLLRSIDIASRVGVGFEPRSWAATTTVTGEDFEAWIEVPLADVGWTFIHPTPDRDKFETTQTDDQKIVPERNTQVPLPPPIRGADPEADPTKEAEGGSVSPPPAVSGGFGWLATALVIGGAVTTVPLITIVLPVLLIAWLKLRRRRRRRTEGSLSERVANGFREVLDVVVDLGRPLPEHSTRRELAGFIGTPSAPMLAAVADRLVFAPDDPTEGSVDDFWGGVDAVIRELEGTVSRADRWKARASLSSLRARRRR